MQHLFSKHTPTHPIHINTPYTPILGKQSFVPAATRRATSSCRASSLPHQQPRTLLMSVRKPSASGWPRLSSITSTRLTSRRQQVPCKLRLMLSPAMCLHSTWMTLTSCDRHTHHNHTNLQSMWMTFTSCSYSRFWRKLCTSSTVIAMAKSPSVSCTSCPVPSRKRSSMSKSRRG